jgi:hypothetical protein
MNGLILYPSSRLLGYVSWNPLEALGRMRKVLLTIRHIQPVGTLKSVDGGSTKIYAKRSMRTEGYIQVIYQVVVKSGREVGRVAEQAMGETLLMSGMRRSMRTVIMAFLDISVCAQQARRSLTISIRIISFQFCNIFLARFTLGILSQNLPSAQSMPFKERKGRTLIRAETYRIFASPFSLPFCLFHESHLALPSISSIPGLGIVISPSVAIISSDQSVSTYPACITNTTIISLHKMFGPDQLLVNCYQYLYIVEVRIAYL